MFIIFSILAAQAAQVIPIILNDSFLSLHHILLTLPVKGAFFECPLPCFPV
jgi:hypothetical protein